MLERVVASAAQIAEGKMAVKLEGCASGAAAEELPCSPAPMTKKMRKRARTSVSKREKWAAEQTAES